MKSFFILMSWRGVSTRARRKFGAKTMAMLFAVMKFISEKDATSCKYLRYLQIRKNYPKRRLEEGNEKGQRKRKKKGVKILYLKKKMESNHNNNFPNTEYLSNRGNIKNEKEADQYAS